MSKTILVTGGTGYIGSWVVKELLEKGYHVRTTLRDKSNTEKYAHLLSMAEKAKGKLEIWEADLLKEHAFDEAAKDAEAIIHVASPFKLDIKDAQRELIDPALSGTRNVLSAANQSETVKKVVLTSSVAAVHGDSYDMYEQNLPEFTEEQFNGSSSIKHQPYSYSKVLAEKEAWKMHDAQNQWKLVVINPSFVLGPALSEYSSSSESLKLIRDMLSGKYYLGVPALHFGFVDVRDVAHAHVLALEKDNASGRHILAERTGSLYDLSSIIKKNFDGKYKLPVTQTPKFMLYLMGWVFGLSAKFIRKNVGYPIKLNTSKSIKELGMEYQPLEKTVVDMVNQMEKSK